MSEHEPLEPAAAPTVVEPGPAITVAAAKRFSEEAKEWTDSFTIYAIFFSTMYLCMGGCMYVRMGGWGVEWRDSWEGVS